MLSTEKVGCFSVPLPALSTSRAEHKIASETGEMPLSLFSLQDQQKRPDPERDPFVFAV